MKWRIVADTSCDLFSLPAETPDADFSTSPFSIRIGGTEYIDTPDISIEDMLAAKFFVNAKLFKGTHNLWLNA